MKKLILPSRLFTNFKCILAIVISILSIQFVQAQRQTTHSFLSKFGPAAYVGYLAYVPKDYASNPTKNYPLLLFLHGVGEKAWMAKDSSSLFLVKKNGPPKLIEEGQDFPFIVISPQCPFNDWENVTTDNYKTSALRPGEFVDEILEKMKTLYRVDVNKIYISGLSMGGAATWSYINVHPEKIAAAIPVAAWIDNPAQPCRIAGGNVAVWTFQGGEDKASSIESYVKSVNACTPSPKVQAKATVYPGVSHDAWTMTYNNSGPGIWPDNIYTWLMSQSKTGKTVTDLPQNPAFNTRLSVYPIPATSLASVRYSSERTDEMFLQLIDSKAKTVFTGHYHVSQGDNVLDLDLETIPNGLYVLMLKGAYQNSSVRMVISR